MEKHLSEPLLYMDLFRTICYGFQNPKLTAYGGQKYRFAFATNSNSFDEERLALGSCIGCKWDLMSGAKNLFTP